LGKKRFKKICIIDLDYTLVNVETTSHFLESIGFQRTLMLMSPLLLLTGVMSLLLSKLFKIGIDIPKYLKLKACLRTLNEAPINELACKYVGKLLVDDRLFNKRLVKILSELCENSLVILLTASISPIANCFHSVGFMKIYSSELVYRNGKFHRLIDLYQRKYMIVEAILRISDVAKMIVIDDSPEKEITELARKERRLKVIKVARSSIDMRVT
jgi:hypothetical protein